MYSGRCQVPAFFSRLQNRCVICTLAWECGPPAGAGYVTRFKVRRSFLDQYEVHQAGGKTILEYWIPAEDLPALNAAIVGAIEVTAEYH